MRGPHRGRSVLIASALLVGESADSHMSADLGRRIEPRGTVSVGDSVFAADCVIPINGSPDRNLALGFKQMMGVCSPPSPIYVSPSKIESSRRQGRYAMGRRRTNSALSKCPTDRAPRCESTGSFSIASLTAK